MHADEARLEVLALEGYYGASHKAFIDGLVASSAHHWRLLTLPDRQWKKRMLQGAGQLAEQARACGGGKHDVLFVTDMLDLAALRKSLPGNLAGLPCLLYFHENQLTYPVRFMRGEYWRFGLINLNSCLAADRVVFNSEFHRREFLGAVDGFLEQLSPNIERPENVRELISAASTVIHPGIALHEINCSPAAESGGPLRILWNHRWEFDKQPEKFFAALESLETAGADYRLLICGESFTRKPEIFEQVPARFGARLEHFGFVQDRQQYLRLLESADVVVSTAAHEFFGIAVMEACAAGCMPLLPDRLSYPGLIPGKYHPECIYRDDDELQARLLRLCSNPGLARGSARCWREIAAGYDQSGQSALIDQELTGIVRNC